MAVEAQGIEFTFKQGQSFRFIANGGKKIRIHLCPQPAPGGCPVDMNRFSGRWETIDFFLKVMGGHAVLHETGIFEYRKSSL